MPNTHRGSRRDDPASPTHGTSMNRRQRIPLRLRLSTRPRRRLPGDRCLACLEVRRQHRAICFALSSPPSHAPLLLQPQLRIYKPFHVVLSPLSSTPCALRPMHLSILAHPFRSCPCPFLVCFYMPPKTGYSYDPYASVFIPSFHHQSLAFFIFNISGRRAL